MIKELDVNDERERLNEKTEQNILGCVKAD
jgi:hypothetical protein